MASLASQLARIATVEKRGSDKFATSFLFDAKQAADYDLDSIYDLGCAGLAELEQLDQQRFTPFRNTLFSAAMKGYDRTLKTREENAQLNTSIALFAQCISQYFLTRSAGKCIEWLLRRFRVNEFNTTELLAGILPFHETPQFAKLASLMKFRDDDIWSFIRSLRRPIRPLARPLLVEQCTRQLSLLRIIGDQMVSAAKRGLAHKTQCNFYIATAVLTLKRVQQVNNNLITLLLPTISYGLLQPSNDQTRVVALILLSQLASRATFSATALTELILSIVNPMSASTKESQMEATLCLLHLTSCQETAPDAFNDKVATSLLSVPEFVPVILLDCSSNYDITSFIHIFVKALIRIDTEQGWHMIEELLRTLPLSDTTFKFVTEQLLHHVASIQFNTEDTTTFTGVTACLERIRLLHADIATLVIETILKGTGQQLVKETDTPLFLALNHADADIRMLAIDQLANLMQQSPCNTQSSTDAEFIQQVLLTRLQSEDDKEMISTVLALPQLDQWIPFSVLFPVLKQLIIADNKCSAIAAFYVIEHLATKQHREHWDAMVALVLPLLYQPSNNNLVAATAKSGLIGHSLLNGYTELANKHPRQLPPYNSLYIDFIARQLVKEGKTEYLLNYLQHGNDRAVLFALLTVKSVLEHTKQDAKLQTQQAYLLAGQITRLLRERLADREFSFVASELVTRLAKLSPEESAEQLYDQLVPTDTLADYLPAAVVWSLHCIVVQLTPPSTDVCWHTVHSEDEGTTTVSTLYANTVRTLFLAVHQEEDLMPFQIVVKALFSLHLAKSPLAFLSSIWSEPSISLLTRIRSLEIASVYWKSYEKQPGDMADFQLYLPWLMSALMDSDKTIRQLAMQCLESLHTVYTSLQSSIESTDGKKNKKKSKKRDTLAAIYDQSTLYGSTGSEHLLYLPTNEAMVMTQQLLEKRAELLVDIECLPNHLSILLNDSNDRSRQTEIWLSFILSSIVAEPSTVLRTRLLQIVRAVQSPLKLRHLAPLILSSPPSITFDAVSASQINVKGSNARKALFSLLSGLTTITSLSDVDREHLQRTTLAVITRDFFAVLSEVRQQQLFSQLVQLTLTEQANVAIEARRVIKHIYASCTVLAYELLQCQEILATEANTAQHTKRSKLVSDDTDVTGAATSSTTAIQRITVVLELIQYRDVTGDEIQLVLPLFDLLAIMLSGETSETRVVLDYVNQLILSGLTRIIRQLLLQSTEGGEAAPSLDASRIRVDLVVQCIRGTTNPQIHGQALLLLASLASVQPDLVLQNIMPVFTFMGASVLRQDDNYSFHIIQQTLEKIIPPLMATNSRQNTRGLMDIFVDAFFHIPRHRRLRLFSVLVSTLGADEHLHQVLLLLLIKYTDRMSKSTEDADTLMEFCRQVSEHSTASTQLKMLHQLVTTLDTTPNELVDNMPEPLKKLATNKQIRQLKWATLEFARQLLESRPFLNQLIESTSNSLEEYYLTLSESLLSLVDTLLAHERSLMATGQSTTSVIKYWRGIARLGNDVLNNVHRLLTLPTFMRIVSELLKHENPSIRRKSMLLFNEKVEALDEGVEITEKELFLGMLPHLTAMIAIKAKPKDREAIEVAINKQTALVSLALLVKHFGRTDPTAFIDVLAVITGEWALGHENRQVAASSIICLSVYCRELGPRVVPLLPKFMPIVVNYMEQQSTATATAMDTSTETQSTTLMRLSLLGLIDVMARHMSVFMGPYLPSILRHLLDPSVVGGHGDQVSIRAHLVIQQLALHVPPRLLLAPTFDIYTSLIDNGTPSLLAYYQFLGKVIEVMDRNTLQQHYKPIFKFFLQLFDIRRVNSFDSKTCDQLETSVINAFLQMVMKLNETMFKPIFLKAVEWAMGVHVPVSDQIPRQKFFYRFIDQLLDQLKSIVVPYYVYILDDVIGKLNQLPSIELWSLLVGGLSKCLLYDNDGFWTTHLSEKILAPLVHQLSCIGDNEEDDTYLTRMKEQLVPCLGQLAVTSGTDVVWKPLNAQVLLNTRDDRPVVRVAALEAVREFYDRLGEEFLILLPETIPFLAELMEDDDILVERTTQQVMAVIERHLGEPLQKYFD
ncbi:hypothetical protein BDF19DRAFT_454726 [Syncephalis fuscata]|nr:hypothetical protein BDF19DRAFT_454726 [Syncephalis fuscata]